VSDRRCSFALSLTFRKRSTKPLSTASPATNPYRVQTRGTADRRIITAASILRIVPTLLSHEPLFLTAIIVPGLGCQSATSSAHTMFLPDIAATRQSVPALMPLARTPSSQISDLWSGNGSPWCVGKSLWHGRFTTACTRDNRPMRKCACTADWKTEILQHWHDVRSRTRAAVDMRWSRSARFALTHAHARSDPPAR
jgi:hypothetical protein